LKNNAKSIAIISINVIFINKKS